ncbi:MAG: hypothetical protein Q3971_01090 [Moraxella sp.]|nr:hypothetical protein [Moraxella sp.]
MNDVTIQSRHILARLGVGLWAGRVCHTQKIPTVPDGFSNPRLHHLITRHKPSRTNQTPPQDTANPPPRPPPLPVVPKIIEQDTHTHDVPIVQPAVITPPLPDEPPPTLKVGVRFYLQGIRYGRWVLMADILGLDDELVSIWHSLKNALANHAIRQQINYVAHEAHYPMINADSDYREHHDLLPADAVFWGFLFGLGADDGIGVACLTPLPDVVTEQQFKQVPTLSQMHANPTLKKQLWAMITS